MIDTSDEANTVSRPFVIVLKGPSSVRLEHGSGARFFLTAEHGQAEVRVLTNWVEAGFDHPLPRELWVDVRLNADSVDEAIDQARILTSAIAPAIAFATNAKIGGIEPHIAYEATAGVAERVFVEYFLPDQRGLIPPTRAADPAVVTATADAVFGSAHWKGLSTSLAHYHAALGHYHVGGESLAVGHLFMAAEALREATLAQYCSSTGRSEAQIMDDEGHENRGHLLAWARRELIFCGDLEVYSTAKDASDGLEHGYRTVTEVRALAQRVCEQTFKYVRTAIVGLLDISEPTRRALLETFGMPADTQSLRRRVTGVLVGDADQLAPVGSEYPILEWNSAIAHFDIDPDGKPMARFTDRFTVRTAESIGFQMRAMEVYGRAQAGAELKQIDLQIESSDLTTARDEVLPLLTQLSQAVAACGPGEEGADFSQPLSHLLELFNRTKGLYLAARSLCEQGLPEEALIVGRALLRDALRLLEAADADEATRVALAFGWRFDSVEHAAELLDSWTDGTSPDDERDQKLEELREGIGAAAARFGAAELRSFSPTEELLITLDDEDYPRIDRLARAIEEGWDIATRSRRREGPEGGMGLHDTAPDSWVYPLAAKFLGGSYLMAAESARRIFGWEDPDGRLAASRKALDELEAEHSQSGTSDAN